MNELTNNICIYTYRVYPYIAFRLISSFKRLSNTLQTINIDISNNFFQKKQHRCKESQGIKSCVSVAIYDAREKPK